MNVKQLHEIAVAEVHTARLEERVGPDHPELATSLNNLAALYQDQGVYAKAKQLYERALAICERVLEAEHPQVATSLNNLAALYQMLGAYSDAEPLYQRALRIREKILGAEHPEVSTSLNNLGLLYKKQGAYSRAEPIYERALGIRERVFGSEHPEVAASLNNLVGLYVAQGRYDKGESMLQRALHIYEKVLGPEHPNVAVSLNNLANFYQGQAAYAKAEPLLRRALGIHVKVFGTEHPNTAAMLDNLAGVHRALGAYDDAERLYERVLAIREAVFGPEHPDVAVSISNLANLYERLGAYDQAKPLYERVLHIRENALGSGHEDVATSLDDLAGVLRTRGAYEEAARLYERALRIREDVLGDEHPDRATSLFNIAGLYHELGKYREAERLYLHALDMYEDVLGSEHPSVATALNDLALLYQNQGSHDLAGRLYDRALRIRQQCFGLEHPDVATSLNNFAVHSWIAGDRSRCLSYFARAVAARERHTTGTLAALPERRKRLLLQTHRTDAEALVSYHAHCAPGEDEALSLAFTEILRSKGRVLEEVARTQALLRQHLSPELQDAFDMLQQRRAQLLALRRAPIDAHRAAELQALQQDIERLETDLSRQSSTFRAHLDPVTIESVQAALPRDAALVEFVRYRRFDPGDRDEPWKETHYLAYVLRNHRPPQWVPLGEAKSLEVAVGEAHAALKPGRDARQPLRTLDELVFAPIRRLLGPTSHFLISPDAALHLVPFAALIDEEGHYLVDRLRITYLTSGRDLVRSATQGGARSKPLVVAAHDYGGRLPDLPGAKAEAAALQKHFMEIKPHVGPDATKDKLTSAQGPLFVHVATHGFFRTPRASASSRTARSWRDERDIIAAPSVPPLPDDRPDIEDALDDAGLIFAGASEADATLTAREIAGIDLRGTQLVVLSACDTGVGQVAQSEGVYGLRRALAIAGAETQVVSLWKVDDKATSELMDRYYGGLRSGDGRSEALRQAQLTLLRDEQYAHPCYWAAFVPIGDERPLSQNR